MLTPLNVSDLSIAQQPPNNPDIINIYNTLCMKLQISLQKLEIRMRKIVDLGSLLENCTKNGIHSRDVFKIHESLKDLAETLTEVSRNEIELNHLYREIDKKSLENMKIRVAYEKMKARSETLEGKLRELEKRQQFIVEENGQMLRTLQQETSKQQENQKKVYTLKNRLEAIVQNSHNQYIVNNSIRDLMKENDSLKWVITAKNGEIEKLMDLNQQLKNKVLQLTKKIENLNQRKLELKKENEEFFLKKEEPLHLLAKAQNLPITLDFRHFFLKNEYSTMLNDIALYGASAFSAQIINNVENNYQKKTAVEFVTSQFIGFKDFGETLNNTLSEIINLLQVENVIELMKAFSKNFKNILKGEEVFLWLEEEVFLLFFFISFHFFLLVFINFY